ncbi:outer membrane protein assembly factor BamA [Sphingomonas sinipercae]|uniref:Outer membrane protein assembly factor BamA n=2 Tax=Sphingomonas sinipercae TaxID=2714944 RepID=A0A6G7ZQX1_9SPHN|nr:outer membrane protein assembly factor BamA [Sphingomonas sinipercae]
MLLVGTALGGWSPLHAQAAAPATGSQPAPAVAQPVAAPAAPASSMIRSISVRGNQRLEPATIISYASILPGQSYTAATLDQALKDLYATDLFNDVNITGAETGNLVINVKENPVINRIVLEGNKRLKTDKIMPEIKLAPRQIFTRTQARSDVERIVELYKREGRFAARVEPKIVQLDQNRVDVVFEIYEGDKSKIRAINIIGNDAFKDDRLRKEMFSRESGGVLGFLKSNDTYDPDRLAADQSKLRIFYLTQGYADFRVISALAELTPDRRDFIITYVVEEGPRYKFGEIKAESALRDLPAEKVMEQVKVKSGEWFNAQAIEDTVTDLSEIAGNLGYAFSNINPGYDRDPAKRLMNINFRVEETPRVYVERVDINGNTVTRDKVIRREFRVNEGDAFSAIKVKRTQDRIQSLGYFQDKFEIKQSEGSADDRVVLTADLQEKPTGQIQFSGGYSSLEQFVLSLSVQQNNFRGMGQSLGAGIDYSRYSRSINLSFSEPYLFDRQVLLGGQIYRRDYNSFNYSGGQKNTTYGQVSTGGGLRLGFPINEYTTLATRYSLVLDDVTLSKSFYYTDPDGNGPLDSQCDPLKAGRYLCDELGKRVTSTVGYSIGFDNTDGIRPTRGQRLVLSQDFAGLGGDVRYLRTRADATKYWGRKNGIVLSAHAEGGYIHPFSDGPASGADPIRLTDRFFGPSPSLRGFDIRGVGPRIQRLFYNAEGVLDLETAKKVSDAVGGHAYYMARVEVEPPMTSGLRSLGIRPSVYVEAGSVFGLKKPLLNDIPGICALTSGTGADAVTQFKQLNPGQTKADCATLLVPGANDVASFQPGSKEFFLGNSAKPRLSVGFGFNWVSPFGPLRIDLAKALLKQDGDEDKVFSFNVGTAY